MYSRILPLATRGDTYVNTQTRRNYFSRKSVAYKQDAGSGINDFRTFSLSLLTGAKRDKRLLTLCASGTYKIFFILHIRYIRSRVLVLFPYFRARIL